MPATMIITCPKCSKKSKGPAELTGKKLRCKACGSVFAVGGPAPTKPKPGPTVKRSAEEPPVAALAEEETVVAEQAEPEEPTVVALADEEEQHTGSSYGIVGLDTAPRCAYCAMEMESHNAVVCLHCGYNTQTRQRIEVKKTFETTSGDRFMWLLPGILSALTTLFLLTCIVLFWAWFPTLAEELKDEWTSFFFGLWARIWGSVIALFLGYLSTRFAIRRLIFENTPPEIIKR